MFIKGHGGIEPQIFDLQSKRKPFTTCPKDTNNKTCTRVELASTVSVAQYSNH